MAVPDHTLTIRVRLAGALVYAVVLDGVLVLAVIGVVCLLGGG